jgi:hypothetical protein
MFMRFRGGGVGHKSIQKAIKKFIDDRWPNELKGIRDRAETGNSAQMDVDEEEEPETVPETVVGPVIDPEDDVELEEDEVENQNDSDLELEESAPENEAGEVIDCENTAGDNNEEGDSEDEELEYADY